MELFDLPDQPQDKSDTAAHSAAFAPLAERMRPRTLAQFAGQRHLLGEGNVLAAMLANDSVSSMILWGPPGSGKTTLARIIAGRTGSHFREFSAVTSSIADIKKVVEEAKARLQIKRQRTIVFVDEIHRFNKAQQDAFLPHVEAGTFTLIGATTENPSFSIISALLSRARVFTLEPLDEAALRQILEQALTEVDKAISGMDEEATTALVRYADGDARRLLTAVETIAATATPGQPINVSSDYLREVLQHKHLLYDKSGEQHFNLISALHKSIRDSDPQGAIYWLARMLEAGEDPLFLARRLTRAAAEDIGLADPQALILASSVFDAVKNIGMPESNVILAELAVYLALAPKSNALYIAYGHARTDVETTANEPVPLHLRNAPTALMKQIGYGKGYKYAHDFQDAAVEQEHLPPGLKGRTYYRPIRGWETKIIEKDTHKEKDKAPGEKSQDASGLG